MIFTILFIYLFKRIIYLKESQKKKELYDIASHTLGHPVLFLESGICDSVA